MKIKKIGWEKKRERERKPSINKIFPHISCNMKTTNVTLLQIATVLEPLICYLTIKSILILIFIYANAVIYIITLFNLLLSISSNIITI